MIDDTIEFTDWESCENACLKQNVYLVGIFKCSPDGWVAWEGIVSWKLAAHFTATKDTTVPSQYGKSQIHNTNKTYTELVGVTADIMFNIQMAHRNHAREHVAAPSSPSSYALLEEPERYNEVKIFKWIR